jgi:hypothetical protein
MPANPDFTPGLSLAELIATIEADHQRARDIATMVAGGLTPVVVIDASDPADILTMLERLSNALHALTHAVTDLHRLVAALALAT